MASPINECHKKLMAAQKTIDRMTAKRLETIITLEAENKLLRTIVGRMDHRLDMHIDYFAYAIEKAGTIGELRKWFDSYIGKISEIDFEDDEWENKAKTINLAHGLEWDETQNNIGRCEKIMKWGG